MRRSFDIAHSLLDVDKEKLVALSPRVNLFACVLGIINLVFSGLSENFLANDATGYYISLFLFVHSAAYTLFAFSLFLGNDQEILFKTKIFPTNSTGRMIFVIVSAVRHPLSVALIASNSIFFLILYRHNIVTGIIAVVLYFGLMVSILTICSLAFLFLDRRKTSASIALLFVILLTVSGLAGAMVFDSASIMTSIPLVSSCVRGIQSATASDYAGIIQSFAILGVTSFAVIFLGRRIA